MGKYVVPMGEDDILFHAGVKGMKWGVRKQRETGGPRQSFREKRMAGGAARVAKYGGSKKKAAAIEIGKSLATNLVGNMAVVAMPPGIVQTGVAALSTGVQLGVAARTVVRVTSIAQQPTQQKR